MTAHPVTHRMGPIRGPEETTWTHRPSWHTLIEAFCAGYGLGFTIVWDDHPSKRPDAVGEPLRGPEEG